MDYNVLFTLWKTDPIHPPLSTLQMFWKTHTHTHTHTHTNN